jgi:hypothetical protein
MSCRPHALKGPEAWELACPSGPEEEVPDPLALLDTPKELTVMLVTPAMPEFLQPQLRSGGRFNPDAVTKGPPPGW